MIGRTYERNESDEARVGTGIDWGNATVQRNGRFGMGHGE